MQKVLASVLFASTLIIPVSAKADNCDDTLLRLKQRACVAQKVIKEGAGTDETRGMFVAAMHGALKSARAVCGTKSIRIDDALDEVLHGWCDRQEEAAKR